MTARIPKSFKLTFKPNWYRMSVFRGSRVNLSTPTFSNINLTKKIEIYFLFQKLRNNGCNNLYFHLYTFDMSYKLVSYLTLLSECGLLNSLTPFTSNINLTEAITNLLVPWKSNQKLLQYSPFKT